MATHASTNAAKVAWALPKIGDAALVHGVGSKMVQRECDDSREREWRTPD